MRSPATQAGNAFPGHAGRAWPLPPLALRSLALDYLAGARSLARAPGGRLNVRQPQQERSRATRQALLDAAITSLGELGWGATTVAIVAERAGVSRGAAQHHFPTREKLFTAAIDELMSAWIDDLRRQRNELPAGSDRIHAVVARIVEVYTGPLFRAALELWVAAGADPVLRGQIAPFERRIGREAHRVVVELLAVDESQPGVREAIQATLDLARGLGLATLLSDDRRRRERIVSYWVGTLESTLGDPSGS